ncbi:MAG: Crp/Fnr family transcriptional regulator [Anaerolineales bacterium]|nr:Crp/Fnr family transcriptional regulator [Anaerolineales bacterium]
MFNLESLAKRLGKVSHFQGMPEPALQEIVYAGQVLKYSANDILFHEGDPCAGLYVLLTGKVYLYKLGIQGQETLIAVINPVIMFNEASVLDKGPNPVTAVAVHDCVTWRVDCHRYHTLMERYPKLGTGLLQVMAKRNRLMLAHLEDLISRPVLARAAKAILDISEGGQASINRRTHSNIEIATRVATTHEAISRSLKAMQKMGLITCNRSMILVNNPEDLATVAQVNPLQFESDVA